MGRTMQLDSKHGRPNSQAVKIGATDQPYERHCNEDVTYDASDEPHLVVEYWIVIKVDMYLQ